MSQSIVFQKGKQILEKPEIKVNFGWTNQNRHLHYVRKGSDISLCGHLVVSEKNYKVRFYPGDQITLRKRCLRCLMRLELRL